MLLGVASRLALNVLCMKLPLELLGARYVINTMKCFLNHYTMMYMDWCIR